MRGTTAIHDVLSKGSFAKNSADDGIAELDPSAKSSRFNYKEAKIDLNLFYIAMRGHPIGTAVAVVPTFHGPDDLHSAPERTDRDALRSHLQPDHKPAELAASAVPVAIDPLERGLVRPYPHPGDQLWRLSDSTVTFSDVE